MKNKKTKKVKKVRMYNCEKCKAQFKSKAWLTRHENKAHPYVPPKITIEEVPTGGFTERHKLMGGASTVKVGDSINVDTKYIVRRTKVTEGQAIVEVELEKVEGVWRKN